MEPLIHGATIADYYRCKKINGKTCQECKAVAAAYMRARKRANPSLYKDAKRKYYQKYPHKKTELNRKKSRKETAIFRQVKNINFSTKDVLDLWGTDCHICSKSIDMRLTRHCGQPGWELGLHLDHVIPISKGGHNIISNVKPSHARCNLNKSNKTATA